MIAGRARHSHERTSTWKRLSDIDACVWDVFFYFLIPPPRAVKSWSGDVGRRKIRVLIIAATRVSINTSTTITIVSDATAVGTYYDIFVRPTSETYNFTYAGAVDDAATPPRRRRERVSPGTKLPSCRPFDRFKLRLVVKWHRCYRKFSSPDSNALVHVQMRGRSSKRYYHLGTHVNINTQRPAHLRL